MGLYPKASLYYSALVGIPRGPYLTATGSADSTGLDADVYVEYIRLA